MEFELSNTCNLECVMCTGEFSSSIRKNREKLPPLNDPYGPEFIEQLEEFIPYLTDTKFYGGEPFLIDLYYDIWEKIIELNPKCRINIQTNATILNNKVKSLLERGNFLINISLDSLEKDTYESIRVNAKFERVLENVEYFIDYCKRKGTFIGISACFMRQNWKEMPSFIQFCNEKQVPVYFHMVVNPKHSAVWMLPVDELEQISCFFHQEFNLAATTEIELKNRQHFNDLVKQVDYWYSKAQYMVKEQSLSNIKDTGSREYFFERLKLQLRMIFASLPQSELDKKFDLVTGKIDRLLNTLQIGEEDLPELYDNIVMNVEGIEMRDVDDLLRDAMIKYPLKPGKTAVAV
jgi:sulfatase maturation enzyme AslB (radical SAM superfamily)